MLPVVRQPDGELPRTGRGPPRLRVREVLEKVVAAGDQEQETPEARRVSLVQRRLHRGAQGEIEVRGEAYDKGPCRLRQRRFRRGFAAVGKEHEGYTGRYEEGARQMVSEGEPGEEGAEQQVAISAALPPVEQDQDNERDKQH